MTDSICKDYYRFIFENSLDAILLTSPDGKIHRANSAACDMFQKTEEELRIGGREGIVDLSDPNVERALKERVEKGRVRAEITYIKKDGSHFIGDVSSAIFKDEEGNFWTAMIIRDISYAKQVEETLKKINENMTALAMYDYLTGIMNRRAFLENLEQEMERANREYTPLSIVLLDIDDFKEINDKYGHLIGDRVLKLFALGLKNWIRPYDLLGRFGGDEFVLCLPNTTLDNAREISERIRERISLMDIEIDGSTIRITASLGVTYYDYQSKEGSNRLISRVDDMMYRSKRLKNCVYTAL